MEMFFTSVNIKGPAFAYADLSPVQKQFLGVSRRKKGQWKVNAITEARNVMRAHIEEIFNPFVTNSKAAQQVIADKIALIERIPALSALLDATEAAVDAGKTTVIEVQADYTDTCRLLAIALDAQARQSEITAEYEVIDAALYEARANVNQMAVGLDLFVPLFTGVYLSTETMAEQWKRMYKHQTAGTSQLVF